jgi:hypothetical protein
MPKRKHSKSKRSKSSGRKKAKPGRKSRARTPKATPRQKAKVHKVMSEFKKGKLRSSSGAKVTSRKQAVAISLSEAGLSRPKRRK